MLLPSAPINQGVCEEPYHSELYNQAEWEYQMGHRELELSYILDFGDEANFNLSKVHFAKSVSLLRLVSSTGEVENMESIERLPSLRGIMHFNKRRLGKLANALEKLYFRNDELPSF